MEVGGRAATPLDSGRVAPDDRGVEQDAVARDVLPLELGDDELGGALADARREVVGLPNVLLSARVLISCGGYPRPR